MLVANTQHDLGRRLTGEQHRDTLTISQIGRRRSQTRSDLRLATAAVATIELNDAVLEVEPRERGLERLVVEHRHFQPAVGDVLRQDRLRRDRRPGAAAIDRPRLRTLLGSRVRQNAGSADPRSGERGYESEAPAVTHVNGTSAPAGTVPEIAAPVPAVRFNSWGWRSEAAARTARRDRVRRRPAL